MKQPTTTLRKLTLATAVTLATLTLSGCHHLYVSASIHDDVVIGHGHHAGHGYGYRGHGYRHGPARHLGRWHRRGHKHHRRH